MYRILVKKFTFDPIDCDKCDPDLLECLKSSVRELQEYINKYNTPQISKQVNAIIRFKKESFVIDNETDGESDEDSDNDDYDSSSSSDNENYYETRVESDENFDTDDDF